MMVYGCNRCDVKLCLIFSLSEQWVNEIFCKGTSKGNITVFASNTLTQTYKQDEENHVVTCPNKAVKHMLGFFKSKSVHFF